MNALDYFFYLFAALTLLCGVLVVANPFSRSPVTSAMFLVLTIFWLAGLFVTLHAFFLAAVQIIVYAGAVMVLFVFVIMLLNLRDEERRKAKLVMSVLGCLAAGSVAFVLVSILTKSRALAASPTAEGHTYELGKILFTDYVLPFEVVSLLLLVAIIGVVLLSKKELK